MDTDIIRLLLIEDSLNDARVIQEYLKPGTRPRIELKWVNCLSQGLEQLAGQPFDAVLLDLNLPDSCGLDTLVQTHARCPRVPIIVLTGDEADESALQAVKLGAEDYIGKGEMASRLLVRSIRYAIERAWRRQANERLAQAMQESELRLRTLLENLPDLVLRLDRDGQIEFASHALPGTTIEAMFLADWSDLIAPEHRDCCHEARRRALDADTGQTVELLDKFGNWWACRFARIAGAHETDDILAVCTNITHQKTADQALGESTQRYQQLLAAVNSYTYRVELRNGTPVSTNHNGGCLPVTGYSPDAYQSDPYLWIRMVHPDDIGLVRERVEAVLGGQEIPPMEHRIIRRDGAIRWVRDTIVPHFDGDTLVRYDGLVEDITDRWVAEHALRERELQLVAAQRIQQRFLPTAAPTLPNFDIAGASYPAEFASGDFYDYLAMPNNIIGFAIGDVVGHGIGAALLMSSTMTLVRLLAEANAEVAEILQRVNRFLAKQTEDAFVTLLLARLDPQNRLFTYTSGGHPPGYILDSTGAVKLRLDSTAPPLAISPDTEFPAAKAVNLAPGDLVVLVTDGFQEAMSHDGCFLGAERLLRTICENRAKSAAEIVTSLYRMVCDFCKSERLVDDLTAVVIKAL